MDETDTQDAFWQSYRDLHERWETELTRSEKHKRESNKWYSKVKDMQDQLAIWKERCEAAEQGLDDVKYCMTEGTDHKIQHQELLEEIRDLRVIQQRDRENHEEEQIQLENKLRKLIGTVDTLRSELEMKVDELEKCQKELEILQEKNEALTSLAKMEGKSIIDKACVRNAYDVLLRCFLSLFPQSESENKWQFCEKKTHTCTPAFHLLVSLCHEDLVLSIKGMSLIVSSPKDLVEKTHELALHEKLCRFMRTVQCRHAALFSDMQEAMMKLTELTKQKIQYETTELVQARQSFAFELMKSLKK